MGSFVSYLQDCGIAGPYTIPVTPKQNDLAKRINRILMDMVISKINTCHLPESLWEKCRNSCLHSK